MATYKLLTNVTAVQPVPTAARGPQNPAVPHGPTNPNMPAQSQQFQLTVDGVGAVSATAQLVGSNDGGLHWYSYGDPLVATDTNGAGQKATSLGSPWKLIGAYITAISGTNAAANLTMSA